MAFAWRCVWINGGGRDTEMDTDTDTDTDRCRNG